jgi:hypothetical protein
VEDATMIQQLGRKALEELLEPHPAPCLSIHLPTHRFGPEASEDRARLKDLLSRAEQGLAAEGLATGEARELTAPLRRLLEDPHAWQGGREGLALFAAPGYSGIYSVNAPLTERVEIGPRFLVAPLVPGLSPVERLYVVALSRNQVRVLEVTPGEAYRLDPPGLPATLEEALGYDDFAAEVRHHSVNTSGRGRTTAIFHGRGGAHQDHVKEDLYIYFRRVADAVGALPDRHAPLVLMAVEEYLPGFRGALHDHRPVLGIPGNPDHRTEKELAAAAREAVDEWSRRQTAGALIRWHEMGERERVSTDPVAIVAAADQGRVDTLFVVPGVPRWGTYEPDLGRVTLRSEREPGDDDLVDLAVSRSLAQGGDVIPVDPAAAPHGAPLAAIFRY